MIKRALFILLIFIFSFFAFITSASAETVMFKDDFETYSPGDLPSTTKPMGSFKLAEVVDVFGDNDFAFEVAEISAILNQPSTTPKIITIKFSLYISDGGYYLPNNIKFITNANEFEFLLETDKLTIYNGYNPQIIYCEHSKWHDFEITIDNQAGIYNMRVDDIVIADGYTLMSGGNITFLFFLKQSYGIPQIDYPVYLDNVLIIADPIVPNPQTGESFNPFIRIKDIILKYFIS
jgi:hypothetical protein